MGQFLGNYDHYSKVAHGLLGTMRLWLLPFAEDERTRKRIEAAIGECCREAPKPGARFFDEVVRFHDAPTSYESNNGPSLSSRLGPTATDTRSPNRRTAWRCIEWLG
jgi:hypothetical protein